MKLAILSDIHEGLNRKRTATNIMEIIKKWITENNPDCFVICGDLTAGPEKSFMRLNELQEQCPNTKILFVHGNHDIYHDDSRYARELLLKFQGNLGNGPIEIGNDWVVVGDGGWYDYSFGLKQFHEEDFVKGEYNDFTWPDMLYSNWSSSDKEVTAQYFPKLEKWLEMYSHKKLIMVTHFVPFEKFIQTKGDPSWDFFNAMMGSKHFGELALKYKVKKYIFGHIHTRYHENYQNIEVICNPLGYYPHEWINDTAEKEINSTIKVIELK